MLTFKSDLLMCVVMHQHKCCFGIKSSLFLVVGYEALLVCIQTQENFGARLSQGSGSCPQLS